MKALILAAGLGTRLAPITNTCPKSLVPVNGKPILFQQIENLLKNHIQDITIIAGYKADLLGKEVRIRFPHVKVIYNHDYATTNNMYSAYLGRESVRKDSFILMNGDVYFDDSILSSLLSHSSSNAIVTDIGVYIEESMKVVEENGKLINISKEISPEEALGVSIDIYKFSSAGADAFFKKCHEYIEIKKDLNLWSEVALNDVLKEIKFTACPVNGRWIEIDNHKDLEEAENIFSFENKW